MRIGFLTYGLDRAPTGIGRYAIELLRALAALPHGPEVVLLTTEREDQYGLWTLFEHHALPGCRLLPALMSIGNILISQAAQHYRLDIIHDPNGIAPFLWSDHGARRIVTIHDAFAFVVPQAHNRLDNWRYRFMLPYALRRADAVFTISERSRQDIKQYLAVPNAKLHIITYGIQSSFKPVTDADVRRSTLSRYGIKQPYLLYVGGINARKNIARLFEAFARVHECHPELTLVIGGQKQWQTDEIYTTFRYLNLDNEVHFTGYVEHSDLPALYSAAEAFVFPSLYEGFGLPPLEAMACGTPVVTSNISSLPEVVGDAALTVDPYDVGALARAIERTLTDEALRKDLRRRGPARSAQFTWEQTARKTTEVYERLLNERPAS